MSNTCCLASLQQLLCAPNVYSHVVGPRGFASGSGQIGDRVDALKARLIRLVIKAIANDPGQFSTRIRRLLNYAANKGSDILGSGRQKVGYKDRTLKPARASDRDVSSDMLEGSLIARKLTGRWHWPTTLRINGERPWLSFQSVEARPILGPNLPFLSRAVQA